MYAWYWFRNLARAGVGAALLCLLGTCQPDWRIALRGYLYFRRQGGRVLLYSERAFGVSIDRNDSARTWHLQLGTMSKINSSLRKLSGDPKTTSSVTEPVQLASTLGMTPLKVVFVGLILEGSIPIFRTVS